ncbi:hypothetical protein [Spirosoma agri]|uniref:Uncharacterized protein n=1 Tax=Spirosoma agri TaxID=1987381 RepID=A0A6M0ITA8_9BACT|nr:hypothetical protein [Spirosoma agri]NEU70955.1 hypothetical protein [Spirosoma agri]
MARTNNRRVPHRNAAGPTFGSRWTGGCALRLGSFLTTGYSPSLEAL